MKHIRKMNRNRIYKTVLVINIIMFMYIFNQTQMLSFGEFIIIVFLHIILHENINKAKDE